MSISLSTTIPATEARTKFFKILNSMDGLENAYTITLEGRPKAVLMSAEEYESWIETLEIVKDRRLMKEIKQAEKEFHKGEYYTLQEVVKKEGFMIADKGKEKYEVSSRRKQKSSKKPKKDKRQV